MIEVHATGPIFQMAPGQKRVCVMVKDRSKRGSTRIFRNEKGCTEDGISFISEPSDRRVEVEVTIPTMRQRRVAERRNDSWSIESTKRMGSSVAIELAWQGYGLVAPGGILCYYAPPFVCPRASITQSAEVKGSIKLRDRGGARIDIGHDAYISYGIP